ncbi:MAG: DUF4230 domain-containing protein [Thomasclavelia sp.]|nr:DUF4230 domain-containing protein [Thomasclavelia sp.]
MEENEKETKVEGKEVKKKSKKEKKPRKQIFNSLNITLLAVALIIAGIFGIKVVDNQSKEEVSTRVLREKVEACSDLITTKVHLYGLVDYDNKKIPFLTQDSYSMVYEATVSIGINIKKVDVSTSGSKVIVKVPEIKIKSINVDPDSIEYYDTNFALFKGDNKKAAVAGIKKAKADAKKKLNMKDLKSQSKKQIKALIDNLFKDNIGDKTLDYDFYDK